MPLISLRDIRITFHGPPLLDNISLDIHKGQRICILGRNGAGKSTLMKIIAGDVKPDAGEIISEPGLRIACLSQDVPENISGMVFDVVAGGAGPAGEALAAYHRENNRSNTDIETLHALQHNLTELEGWNIEPVVNRVLEQVQVAGNIPFESLSGGMRRKVFLARALVREPDLLLLDEPTNHLDLEFIAWLEGFLVASRLTVMFVTHDRRLLRKLATRIVEVDRGTLFDWSCDYPTFLERKQAVLDNEEKAWEVFDKKLAQEEIWIRRGVKARRGRSEGRVNALKKMREERRKRRARTGQVSMAISMGERSGDIVLKAENVSFAYGSKTILNNFSFTLIRGDRIGVVGTNGCGKTTLLNLLLGNLKPQRGTVEHGANTRPLYFDQLRKGIDPEKTVCENISPGSNTVFINGSPRHVVTYLQDFLFTPDRARTPVKFLSGGEKHRLLLARLFTRPSNLLVFDEPTNDLDTETLELLEEVLMEYKGTLLVVSHDREFLNNVVTSALIYDKTGAVNEYVGGYDDWERQLALHEELPAAPEPAVKKELPAEKPRAKKISQKEQKELETLPARLEALEAEQKNLFTQLAVPAQCKIPGFVAASRARLVEIAKELASGYSRWAELDALPKK